MSKKNLTLSSLLTSDPVTAAQGLLGSTLRYQQCEGMIVETEAYAHLSDPACHSFTRVAARSFVERYPAGSAYVYLNYGIHWLFNILIKGKTPEQHGFVLVRALQPLQGIELMKKRRSFFDSFKKEKELCNGPGKLTQAFAIHGSHHGVNLLDHPDWKLTMVEKFSAPFLATPRIGISRAQERLWRFVIPD